MFFLVSFGFVLFCLVLTVSAVDAVFLVNLMIEKIISVKWQNLLSFTLVFS